MPAPGSAAGLEITIEGVRGLIRAGRYQEAERASRALLGEVEQVYGTNSLEAADVLDQFAIAQRRGGKGGGPEALEVCERALRLKERWLGGGTAGYAISLENLALLHTSRGNFTEARGELDRVLAIQERVLGKDRPEVAMTLLYLGNLESTLGHDAAARPLVDRALAIQRATLSPEDPDLAVGLNMLGSLRYREGAYAEAQPLFEQVLRIEQIAYGIDHPAVATGEHNLGCLYEEMGDYERAREHLERALEMRRRTLGENHWLVASTLTNLGIALESLADSATAKARYREALRIEERTKSAPPSDMAWTIMRLGRLLEARGDFDGARPLLRRALALQDSALGPENPELAWTLGALAAVAWHDGDLASAAAMYRRALAIDEKAYGSSHPDVVRMEGEYARFLVATGDTADAFRTALRAVDGRIAHLRLVARGLAERQAVAYAGAPAPALGIALTIASHDSGPRRADVARAAWDGLIRSRMLALDEIAARHRTVASDSSDPAAAAMRRSLDAARNRFANLMVRGLGDDDPDQARARIERARSDMERAERDLAARSEGFRIEQSEHRQGFESVALALPPGAALVAYARFDSGSVASYAAFVLRPGGDPVAIPLGPAREMDDLVARWRREVSAGLGAAGGAPSREARRLEGACDARGVALRRRAWDPIASYVAGAPSVYLVLDGSLHLVNFAALPVGPGRYLIEQESTFHVLTSERDLAAPRGRATPGKGLLALGGPAFDAPLEAAVRSGTSDGLDDSLSGEGAPAETRGLRSRAGARGGSGGDCDDLSSIRFRPLPESSEEVVEIASAWGDSTDAVVLTGAAADESAVKRRAPGRLVVHLATHGFFLDAVPCEAPRATGPKGDTRRGIGGMASSPPTAAKSRPSFRNPLLLAGLAFAGANRRDRTSPNDVDGILTAEEVASIDLTGVDWVVLSGCDTGLGRLAPGEGVVGLRRAFQAAGARTVIMSLWDVEDRSARQWMRALYAARLDRRESAANAVRDASLDVLRDRRAHGRSTHPYFWAPFVAVGD